MKFFVTKSWHGILLVSDPDPLLLRGRFRIQFFSRGSDPDQVRIRNPAAVIYIVYFHHSSSLCGGVDPDPVPMDRVKISYEQSDQNPVFFERVGSGYRSFS